MGQITATRNLLATKVVRLAGQIEERRNYRKHSHTEIYQFTRNDIVYFTKKINQHLEKRF